MERLQTPYASETFSVLGGEGALVVDFSLSSPRPPPSALAQARRALGELSCPTLALVPGELGEVASDLADRFDVLVVSREELALVLDAIARTPLAALGLVQLLRQTESLEIHDALIAESFVYSMLQSGPEFGAWASERPEPKRRRSNPAPAVLLERSGELLELTLNRPEKHNAFSKEMRDALAEALGVVVSDGSIAEVVLRGAGPSFCSGGDLDEFGTLPDPVTANAVRATRNPGRLLASCADRVRCELHGACVGAGIELPAFTHHVRAHPDAFFQLPEVRFGLVPGAGGTVSIPRRIGRQKTAYLALTGIRLDASTALRWGLVDGIA